MSASHKTKEVIVLCPNGRRVTIKTSITTSIGQIIEEACLKQKFDPYSYNIKHLQRTLDPSSTLQYSNIPNHAQLELIEASERREEGYVTVNLVTDRGQRLISDFSPSSSLWDVLIHHENQTENNFCVPTASSGLEPFIVYTMRKVIGEELKSITLKSLGLFRGRCMMRYNVQKLLSSGSHLESKEFLPVVIVKPKTAAETSKTCSEVHKVHNVAIQIESSKELEPQQEMVPELKDPFSIEEMECGQFLESDSISMPAGEMEILEQSEAKFESSVIEDLMNQNDFQERLPLKNSDSADNLASDQFEQDVTEQTLAPKIIPLSDHDSLLFSLDDAAPTLPSQESDDFFELTVAEVHSLYHEQKKQLEEMDKMPLMMQQMRQLDKDSRLLSAMNRHPVTQLRICFPDRHVIQANFKPRNTIKEVMDFLRPLLVKSDLNFYLYTTFPRKVLDPELSLVEAGCIPKARLYFDANEDGLTFLSEKTLGKKSSFEGASNAVIKSSTKLTVRNQENFLSSQEAPSRSSAQISQPEPNVNRISSTQNQLKPKWFRLGK